MASSRSEISVEETLIEAPLWNEQWVIRPLRQGPEYSHERACALEFVRSVVWQNDAHSWALSGGSRDTNSSWVAQLGAVAAFGAADSKLDAVVVRSVLRTAAWAPATTILLSRAPRRRACRLRES